MKWTVFFALWLVGFASIASTLPQFSPAGFGDFDPEENVESRRHHRHHVRKFGLLENFGAQTGQLGLSNLVPGGGNFRPSLGSGGPAQGTGSANAGNGAQANGVGIAQPPPGGIGLGLGIGLALSTPFGNIAISNGEGFSFG